MSSHSSPSPGEAGGLYRWCVVGLLSVIYFVAFADRLALSLLVEPIKRELKASDAQMGALFGLYFAAALALLSLPLGRIADRGNRRNLIAAAIVVWSLMTAAAGLARNFGALLVCRVGLAAGEAGLTPAALSMISDLFPSRSRGLPVALYLTAGVAGATGSLVVVGLVLHAAAGLSHIAFPVVGPLAPWRLTFILIGLPTTALAVLLRLAVREPTRAHSTGGTEALWEAFAYLRLRLRENLGFYCSGALMALLSISATAWYPTYLIRDRGLAPSDVAYLFGTASVLAGVSGSLAVPAIGQALATRRSDGLKITALAAVAIGAPCFALGAATPGVHASVVLIAVANFCFIGGINVPALVIQQSAPSHLRAQLAALYFLCVNLGGLGTGPLLTAEISTLVFGGDHGLGPTLTSLGAIAGAIAFLALLSLPSSPARAASGLPGPTRDRSV